MALFGKKKTAPKAEETEEMTIEGTTDAVSASPARAKTHTVSKRKRPQYHSARSKYADRPDAVLLRPRITEKATASAEHQAYVFEIDQHATKRDVMDAVKHFYNVTPIKVNIVNLPRKRRISRTSRTRGVTAAVRKAYIYLKAGDTIEIV